MTAVGGAMSAMGGGITAATARVDAIRARLGALAAPGTQPAAADRRATPSFDLAAAAIPAAASGAQPGAAPAAARAAATATTATTPAATVAPRGPAPTGAASPGWAAKLPAAGRPWATAIEDAAEAAGVEPALLAALVQHESGFDPEAVSRAGARGLTQLMPGTAAGLGVDPRDPLENLAGGARYLKEQLDRFGSVDLALAAYNAGPGRVSQAGGVPRIPETMTYVDKVTATWRQLR